MASRYTEYHVQLSNSRTGSPIDDDTGTYNVLTASSPAEVTIYSNDTGTSASNPGTITDGEIHFFTLSTVASVDLTVLTASGHAFFLEGLTPSQHRLEVNPDDWGEQKLVLQMTLPGASATMVDTGFDLPTASLVRDAFVHIVTVASDTDVNVGTSVNTDGFLAAIDTSGTGMLGTVEDLTAGSIGVLLATSTSSAIRKRYVPANATSGRSIVWEQLSSSTVTTAYGYIYIIYDLMPTVGN